MGGDRFGSLVAAGKLGIVQKAGATARLIGDSSVSHQRAHRTAHARHSGSVPIKTPSREVASIQPRFQQGPQKGQGTSGRTGSQHILCQRPQWGYKVGLLQNLPFWMCLGGVLVEQGGSCLHPIGTSFFCITVTSFASTWMTHWLCSHAE